MPSESTKSHCGELVDGLSLRPLAGGRSTTPKDIAYIRKDSFSRLLLGMTGEGSVIVDGAEEPLRERRLLLIPAESRAEFRKQAGLSFRWLYFQADYSNCLNLFRIVKPASLALEGADFREFDALLEGLASETLSGRLLAQALLAKLLAAFFEGSTYEANASSPMRRLLPVLTQIDERLAEDLDAAKLAKSLCVTPQYFGHLFAELTGEPLTRYIARRRIQKVQERMLLDADASVKELAASVGFEDPFYFTRVFKKIVGESPSEYRKSRSALGEG